MNKNLDLESSSLLGSEVSSEERSFSKFTKATIAICSLLFLGAIACLSYNTPAVSSSVVTNLLVSKDVAVCKNNYIMGVTPRTTSEGCAIFSNSDLYAWYGKSKAMPTVTICVGSSLPGGIVDIDFDELKDLDLNELSGISVGENVQVQVFDGPGFTGQSAYILNSEQDGRLSQKDYPDGSNVNGNVKSLKIITQVTDFFAGDDCGYVSSVCIGVGKASALKEETDNGCIVLANIDLEAHGHSKSNAKFAKLCGTGHAGTISLDARALTAAGMIQASGMKESSISYINRGQEVKYVQSFEGKSFDGESNLKTGSLSRSKFTGEDLEADNVYSIKFESFAPKLSLC